MPELVDSLPVVGSERSCTRTVDLPEKGEVGYFALSYLTLHGKGNQQVEVASGVSGLLEADQSDAIQKGT